MLHSDELHYRVSKFCITLFPSIYESMDNFSLLTHITGQLSYLNSMHVSMQDEGGFVRPFNAGSPAETCIVQCNYMVYLS